MQKQIIRIKSFTTAEQRRIAKLWDAARRLMIHHQEKADIYRNRFPAGYSFHPVFKVILDKIPRDRYPDPIRFLDAAVGTGTLTPGTLSGIENSFFSDANPSMLKVLKENQFQHYLGRNRDAYALSYHQVWQATWQELPTVFGKEFFFLVSILGNSLPYVKGWDGEPASIGERAEALGISLKAVFDVLQPHGAFLFDLAKYGEGKLEIGKTEVDGKDATVFFEVAYANGLRYWTLGTEHEQYTLEGLALDIEALTLLLQTIGFATVERVPDAAQPDPLFYESYVAYKRR